MTRLSSILALVVRWGLQLPVDVAAPFLAAALGAGVWAVSGDSTQSAVVATSKREVNLRMTVFGGLG